MRILIIGASGLVGGNMLRYFRTMGWECMGTHFSFPTADTCFFDTLDLTHPDNPDIQAFRPHYIINCGALTHVDLCEEDPERSYKQTVTAQQNIIQLAQKIGSKLVYISTDYIFDGNSGPYTEEAKAAPLNAYGRHKWEAEQLTLAAQSDNLILRITNVYGDEIRGKNFVARILQQIQNGDTLQFRLPYDQYATPVNAYDVARACFALIQHQKKGVYHIASTDIYNRVQLAQRILSYFPSLDVRLEICSTSDLKQKAPRPLWGGLLSSKFLSEFPDFKFSNLDDYLKTKIL